MPELKSLLNPKVAIVVAGVVVFLVAGTLVTIFYIRNPTVADGLFNHNAETSTTSPEGDHHVGEAAKLGASMAPSVTASTSAHANGLTTVVHLTPSHSEITTAPSTEGGPDSNLDSSASTVHAIEPTKRE
ncbi:hypothetical protein V3C99_019081 [Haemonchus contortus]|uniref:Transmembrane protein n=1 Tax=Haemonchus contortus TaxID=6289 RepID=A0A6F7Q6V7_HAECO